MTQEPAPRRKRSRTRRCPICGGESWPIAYGMYIPAPEGENPKVEFAGCCIDYQERVYPATGKREFGTPGWACRNPECRHRWW